jgi:uncharacterized protein
MSDTTATTAIRPTKPTHNLVRPLRLVIPGGESHLGGLLARHFSANGHAVTTLSRNPGPASLPWRTLHWDGKISGPWVESLEGAEVLINLAGRSVDCRYNPANRSEILRSRVDSTAVLGRAIQSLKRPPRLWLNASTATVYRHTYDRAMDEYSGEIGGDEPGAPSTWRFSIDVARQWEQAFFASSTPETRKIALRTAMVMRPEPGGIFEIILRMVRLGLGGAWGDGRQYVSWIHDLDFVRAIEFMIEREDITGPVNLAAPNPLPNRQFLAELREAWGIRIGLPSPAWMLAVGALVLRTETELLLKSRRVVPATLQKHGFAFRFPVWAESAMDLVQRWRINKSEVR